MAAYIEADHCDPDYIETDEEAGQVILIPFVGANGRLGATIMGARGVLDIPNLSLILASLSTLAEGWFGGP